MKLTGFRLLLVLVPMILFAACGDDSDDNKTDGDVQADGDTTDVVDNGGDTDVEDDIAEVADQNGDEETPDAPISLKFNGELMTFGKSIMMDAFYYASDDQTTVGDQKVSIAFPGNATGAFSPGDGVTFNLTYTDGGAWWVRTTDTFTVMVTAYGAVGEPIEGTFSGTVVSEDDDSVTAEISEGRFSVTRSDDT